MVIPYKIGFVGVGNLTQTLIKGLVESRVVDPKQMFASNRSPGKLQKVVDQWGLHGLPTNEEVIDESDIVIFGTKPQDLFAAIDPLVSCFRPGQIAISLAAGVRLEQLQKRIPDVRWIRVMPNTPTVINRGVIGCLVDSDEESLETVVEDLFSPLGYVLAVSDEDQLEALTVSCASGTGFVFELMMYFQDWIEERGFDALTARKMVVETFLGASQLASLSSDLELEELQNKVTSKKGVTAAGLQSMREFEIERALRYSFEKAALRNQELAKQGS